MKKVVLLFLSVILTSQICFAKSAEYELNLARLKNAKSAKIKVINSQIEGITNDIERITINSNMSDSAKTAKLQTYEKKLTELQNKKSEIKIKYKKDKKALKEKY